MNNIIDILSGLMRKKHYSCSGVHAFPSKGMRKLERAEFMGDNIPYAVLAHYAGNGGRHASAAYRK